MATPEPKKRKRQSAVVSTPNKKVAITNGSAGTIKVNTSSINEGLHPALVAASGFTAPAATFEAFVKAKSRKQKDGLAPKTHSLLLHSSKHPRLDFTAAPYDSQEPLSHYVAVFDPTTNQLQVTPAYHLSLRSTLRSEAQEVERDESRRTFSQQKEELSKTFGTRKAQKAVADKTINAIVGDIKGKGKKDQVQAAILEAIDESTANTPLSADAAQAVLAAKPIPKPRLTADTVDKVYTFDTLIPTGEARLLNTKTFQEQHMKDDDIFDLHSSFVFGRLKDVVATNNASRMKALQYIELLLDFHANLANGGRKGKKVPKKEVLIKKMPQWSEQLLDSVRRRFSDDHQEMSKWHQDNLITHICALSLFVDGWTTNTNDLKSDLRLDNKQVAQYFHELGCKVSAPTERERTIYGLGSKAIAAVTRIAKLKLPLDFPKTRTARRR